MKTYNMVERYDPQTCANALQRKFPAEIEKAEHQFMKDKLQTLINSEVERIKRGELAPRSA